MSIRWTLKAFDLKDDTLSDGAWRVLVKLCDLANDHGFTIVGYDHLAETCGGKSVKSIQRHVRTLIESGYVKRKHRYKENKQLSNEYQVVIPSQNRGDNIDPTPENRGDKNEHRGATDLSHRSCLIDPIKDTPIVPNGDTPQKVSNTENPYHKDYRFKPEEKTELVGAWNEIANGKYQESRLITSGVERALKKTYSAYKQYHKEKQFKGDLLNKLEFALLTIDKFHDWAASSGSHPWYLKTHPDKTNGNWCASLEYALTLKTFERIINA